MNKVAKLTVGTMADGARVSKRHVLWRKEAKRSVNKHAFCDSS